MNTAVKHNLLNLTSMAAPAAAVMAIMLPVEAAAIQFNEGFLRKQGGETVELGYFERGNQVTPGSYQADLYLNQMLAKHGTVEIRRNDRGEGLPVITVGLLRELGVNVKRLETEKRLPEGSDDASVVDLVAILEDSSVEFQGESLSLHVGVPQAYLLNGVRGRVDESLWDEGVPAAFTNYQANFNRNVNFGDTADYYYVGLRNGLNVGGWRLRNDSMFQGGDGRPSRFSANRTFVERDVRRLKGTFAAGELYSPGEIFESVRFLGMQISSDLGMRPDNENGYAPVVRGIAQSNAVVEIIQNGYTIYSTTVPPGAFEITDIYPSGSNGDLEVKITEADGSVRRFNQPYSYLPVMARAGSMRYALSGGEYRVRGQARPKFLQGTLVYGLFNNLTGYGGIVAADRYNALNLGVGLNTPYGGLSLDATRSQSRTPGGSQQGQSYRLLYSKTLESTATTFTMMGYRYSTDGYRTFGQHVDELDRNSYHRLRRQKSRFDVNVSQSLGRYGSIYGLYGETSYWNRGRSTRHIQLGHSGSIADIGYNIAVAHTPEVSTSQRSDTRVTLSLSIPLGKTSGSHRLTATTVASSRGESNTQMGMSGYLNERNTINYSVHGEHEDGSGASGGVGLGWDTPSAKLATNYSQSRNGKHMDFTASGSVVAHSGGLTFGQPVGETFAIAQIQDVSDAGFATSRSIRTDSAGYAILPSLQPYRFNWVNLDTDTLDTDTEIVENAKQVVPTRGAIVTTTFSSEKGRRVQFVLSGAGSDQIPFGAQAYDAAGKLLGVVDNASRIFAFGVQDEGVLTIRWAAGECTATYRLPPRNNAHAYEQAPVECQKAIANRSAT